MISWWSILSKAHLRRHRGKSIGRGVVCTDPEAQVVIALDVKLVSKQHLFRTDVHRVRGAAEDILAVLGIGNLSSGSPVEDGTTPSVDVDGEASGVDITGVGFRPPIAIFVNVKHVEETDDLWRGDKRTREVDATLSSDPALAGRAVLFGGEPTALVFEVCRADDEPIDATRVKCGGPLRIEVNGERFPGYVRGVSTDADVSRAAYIERA
ncbi:predicted protein [Postia placenta Mad-698-R]|uniref:Uncharacterized protein n=1 Tax=Postia placenta MAD-698-R-SB12 TaxID=670580 RepID=A0A1X6N833_9APHY|nr:hypothetical protein POSPLADRAFT_1044127 [Postia placenta MAD-698-R-SB12]EED78848.1 predicted protein [Postia placenta Mad-698-R]OSX64626.1 hypothetical protein POSPLADRAFT_1044127 [Postia placenta MAD-698-R-SB12]